MRQIHRQVGGAVGHCGTEERLHLCCGEDRQAVGALHWQMGGQVAFLHDLGLCYLVLPCSPWKAVPRKINRRFFVAGVL